LQYLANKVVLVGSSRGIWRAIAVRLAKKGAAVAINYRQNNVAADHAVAEIRGLKQKAVALQADVSVVGEIRELFRRTVQELGPLDIVVANAGKFLTTPFAKVTEGDYDQIFISMLEALFYFARSRTSCHRWRTHH